MAENTRTLAFQVPESLFQRIKDYLNRNNMTKKAFVIGLIEEELDRDEELLRQQEQTGAAEEEQEDGPVEALHPISSPPMSRPSMTPVKTKPPLWAVLRAVLTSLRRNRMRIFPRTRHPISAPRMGSMNTTSSRKKGRIWEVLTALLKNRISKKLKRDTWA